MAKLSKDIVTTYLSDTTIHGCKYTVERELFVIERICWAIIVFIFFLIVFGLIRAAFISWDENPVMTQVDAVSFPLWSIPFPTITLCAEQIYKQFNGWKIVNTGLTLIEKTCFESGLVNIPPKCAFYHPLRQKLITIINQVINGDPLTKISFSQAVNMAAYKLEKDDSNNSDLQNIYLIIAKIFGDETGKLNPMAIPVMMVDTKYSDILDSPYVQPLLKSSSCNNETRVEYAAQWKYWNENIQGMRDDESYPCSKSPSNPCCHFFGQIVTSNLNLTLLAMKYAIPNYMIAHAALAEYLELGSEAGNIDVMSPSLVPQCRKPGGTENGPCIDQVMRTVWSGQGVCSSFNSPHIFDIYSTTKLLQAFDTIYNHGLPNDAGINGNIINSTGSGNRFQLKSMLDSHSFDLSMPFRKPLSRPLFLVAMNEYYNPHTVFYSKTELNPAKITTYIMTPLISSASDDLKGVPLDKRRCKFSDEVHNITMFKKYSQMNCEFECMMKYAVKKCGQCVPWKMPHVAALFPRDQEPRLCDLYETRCYTKVALKNPVYKSDNCRCLPNCNSIKIAHEERSTYLYEKEINEKCDKDEMFDQQTQNKLKNTNFEFMLDVMSVNGLDNQIPINSTDTLGTCKFLANHDWALAFFELSTDSALKIVQNLRVTFPDKVAVIGGNLGLFTGMSLLSAIEIVFWIWRLCLNYCCSKRNLNNIQTTEEEGEEE